MGDTGDAADKLREDIFNTLNEVLTPKKFDAEKARNVMADMVLLEMVKNGRTVEEHEDIKLIKAGEVEKKLAEHPDLVRQSIRNNGQIKAITEHVTADTLRHFVMTDGAKNLADLMTKRAEHQSNGAQNELDKQMNKENQQEKHFMN